MNSGESALPLIFSSRWRPLISTRIVLPSRSPWASAKPLLATASLPVSGSGRRPETRWMRFSACGR